MWRVKYQQVTVTLSAATLSSLEQASFDQRHAAEHAVARIRAAVFELFPPRTPDDWRDKSRYQGTCKHLLVVWYDLACHLLRRLVGRNIGQERRAAEARQLYQLTLQIPIGLMRWVEEIARRRQLTIPEAAAYAVEYGSQMLASQGGPKEVDEKLRQTWRDIWRAMWKHS